MSGLQRIGVSLFIDPDPEIVRASGTDTVATWFSGMREP